MSRNEPTFNELRPDVLGAGGLGPHPAARVTVTVATARLPTGLRPAQVPEPELVEECGVLSLEVVLGH